MKLHNKYWKLVAGEAARELPAELRGENLLSRKIFLYGEFEDEGERGAYAPKSHFRDVWNKMIYEDEIHENILKNYGKYFNWNRLASYKWLSEEVIAKNIEHISFREWLILFVYQGLSDKFIKKHWKLINVSDKLIDKTLKDMSLYEGVLGAKMVRKFREKMFRLGLRGKPKELPSGRLESINGFR